VECLRAAEALEAAVRGWWPDRAGEDLVAHVATCESCADLLVVATALQAEREEAAAAIRVPPAELVWWRAQLRARQQGVDRASRPILFTHGLALVSTVVGAILIGPLALAWVGTWSAGLNGAWSFLSGLVAAVPIPTSWPDLSGADGLLRWAIPVALAAWLALAPVAIYLAVGERDG
jgi:hypothetical protein